MEINIGPTLQSPPWPCPDNVTLVPQFALTGGDLVLPLGSTSVAKLIAASAHQQKNEEFINSKINETLPKCPTCTASPYK